MQVINLTGEYASQCPELNNRIPLGYVNKTICGCGITTIALENNRDTIILVPNVNLINNKCSQYPNERSNNTLLGVYAGVTNKEITKYVKETEVIKILVTYDSLRKVEHLLEHCDIIVDESDRLLANVKLKASSKTTNSKDVISYLFDALEPYKEKVSFVSATPIPTKYLPDWVDNLDKVQLEWQQTLTAIPYIMNRGRPYVSLINEILKPLATAGYVTINDVTIKKVLIFINSISEIKKTVQNSGILPSEVGYIVGNNVENDSKLKDYTRIEDPYNLPKFTFVTSTGFQGIDLYDKEVISIVVSSVSKSFTMIDISTDLKQAISRQRYKDNMHYGKYIFIYDQTFFDQSEEELLANIDKIKKKVDDGVLGYKELRAKNLAGAMDMLADHQFMLLYTNYDEKTDTFTLNENIFNADKYFLLETRKQYQQGFRIRGLEDSKIVKPVVIPRQVTFRDMANHLKKELKTNKLENVDWGVLSTRKDWRLLLETHYKIYGKVLQNHSKTKEMVEACNNAEQQLKIEAQNTFKLNHTYTRKEIKDKLNKLYKDYKLKRKANHNDMYVWFNIKEKMLDTRVMQILSHK